MPDWNILCRQLPKFEPYQFDQFFVDVIKLAKENPALTAADACRLARATFHRSQVVRLFHALRLDPKSENVWGDAFLRLAGLHYNAGQIAIRRSPPKNARTWTIELELELFCRAIALKAAEGSERKAVYKLADQRVFPYQERRHERPEGRARQRQGKKLRSARDVRRDRLWREYLRIKSKYGKGKLADAIGSPDIGPEVSRLLVELQIRNELPNIESS